MPIQADSVLRAAVRWLERIPSSGVPRTRSLLYTNPRFADLTPTQYETALDWINRAGVLAEYLRTWQKPAEVVFQAAIAEALWFEDFDSLVRSPDEIPADASSALGALGLTEPQAYRLATQRWMKVDTERRQEIGALGEELLVSLLQASVIGTVTHLSLRTDAAGFDILVRLPNVEWHLEVKSSTRLNRTKFYLSRNEYEVMRTDPQWQLVFLTLGEARQIDRICTVDRNFIRLAAPLDSGVLGRWESCSLDAPPESLSVGIPALRKALTANASPLIAPPGLQFGGV